MSSTTATHHKADAAQHKQVINAISDSMAQMTIKKDEAIPQMAETTNSSTTNTKISSDAFNKDGNVEDFESDSWDDAFNSIGTWEDCAKENNVRVSKKQRRKIRRLRDSDDSDYEERPEPSITNVPLVPNPFCLRNIFNSSDPNSGEMTFKIKRVCFNPTITFHYY